MKNRTRFFSGLLVLALCISQLAGCGSENAANEVKEQEKQNIKKEISVTEYELVKDGKSEYCILVPEKATENETFAASELQYFIKEATGAELQILSEDKADTSKNFLSVGETKASKDAGVTPTYEEVKSNGFVLKTIEDDCYIKGFSDIGTRNAVYDWLYYSVDYECYAKDEIVVEKTDNQTF